MLAKVKFVYLAKFKTAIFVCYIYVFYVKFQLKLKTNSIKYIWQIELKII